MNINQGLKSANAFKKQNSAIYAVWRIVFMLLLGSSCAMASTNSLLKQLKNKIADIKSHLQNEESKRSEYLSQLKAA
ncbi:hypothetical protein OFN49_33275, partial [Escherichia coli]|nr:hypothetical protein [Escherichia coli]